MFLDGKNKVFEPGAPSNKKRQAIERGSELCRPLGVLQVLNTFFDVILASFSIHNDEKAKSPRPPRGSFLLVFHVVKGLEKRNLWRVGGWKPKDVGEVKWIGLETAKRLHREEAGSSPAVFAVELKAFYDIALGVQKLTAPFVDPSIPVYTLQGGEEGPTKKRG